MDLQYVLHNLWWLICKVGFNQISLYDNINQMILITLLSLYTYK